MKLTTTRPESNESYDRQQPVRLKQRGIYGGLFKRYSMPKQYTKFQSTEMEEKFFVTFLITHDAGARPLPRATEAFCGVRTKRFYDGSKDLATTMVRLYAALLNGKMKVEDIASCDDDDLPDLDDLIGYPAMLFVKPAVKPDRDGIFANQIDTQAGGFQPADMAMRKAAKLIYDKAEFKYDKNGLRFLASPETQYESPGDNGSIEDTEPEYDDADDTIPF